MRSFAQWRAWYEERAEPCIVEEGEPLYFSPEHGFFYYQVLPGGVFFLDHVATDDIHWMYARAWELARAHGCRCVASVSFHRAAAYVRLFRAHIDLALSGWGANGRWYWAFVDDGLLWEV